MARYPVISIDGIYRLLDGFSFWMIRNAPTAMYWAVFILAILAIDKSVKILLKGGRILASVVLKHMGKASAGDSSF